MHSRPAPGNGSALVTGGDLLFWGDINRRFHAFDADSGKVLFETVLGGMIETSTITYAVKGRQFVPVMTGDCQSGSAGPLGMQKGTKTVRGQNAVYVFALPDPHGPDPGRALRFGFKNRHFNSRPGVIDICRAYALPRRRSFGWSTEDARRRGH